MAAICLGLNVLICVHLILDTWAIDLVYSSANGVDWMSIEENGQ